MIYHCKDCYYFEPSGSKYQKGYCPEFGIYCWDVEESCTTRFRSLYDNGSTCYITSIVCQILGRSDNDFTLQVLRKFRDNVMQKEEGYQKMLYEYDTIGPQIARHLQQDYKESGSDELAVHLYNFYLIPATQMILSKKYDEAVERYQEMTEDLREHYQIPKVDKIEENYDAKQGGHGRVKTLRHPSTKLK